MALPPGVIPEQPGLGQESVWDYPRPPVLQRRDCRIEVTLGGVVVCRADHALLIKETSHPPTYYLPMSAWRPGALEPAAGSSVCEWKGEARYFDVVAASDAVPAPGSDAGVPPLVLGAGERVVVAEAAAWGYPEPRTPFQALAGYVSVYPGRMDQVTVDGELVRPQEGGFYGGWITDDVVGPFKGQPGSWGW